MHNREETEALRYASSVKNQPDCRDAKKMETGHLYQNIPQQLPQEISECLARGNNVKIERIVSKGHRSPPDFWYDQNDNEWVVLLKGEAELRFQEGNRLIRLTEGMYLNIRAHEKHRVEWTRNDADTVWLAVFY
jgi:cupin 2 domain-containing protein